MRQRRHDPGTHWRVVLCVFALLGVTPGVGLYFHQHPHGEHTHVHPAGTEPARANPLDIEALWLTVRGESASATHLGDDHDDGHGHSHGKHHHAGDHEHAVVSESPSAGPPVQQTATPPQDGFPSLTGELPDAARHWHAVGPLHHLAAPLRIALRPAGASRPLPCRAPGRCLVGAGLPAHARGPPSLTAAGLAAL